MNGGKERCGLRILRFFSFRLCATRCTRAEDFLRRQTISETENELSRRKKTGKMQHTLSQPQMESNAKSVALEITKRSAKTVGRALTHRIVHCFPAVRGEGMEALARKLCAVHDFYDEQKYIKKSHTLARLSRAASQSSC